MLPLKFQTVDGWRISRDDRFPQAARVSLHRALLAAKGQSRQKDSVLIGRLLDEQLEGRNRPLTQKASSFVFYA